MVKLLLILFTMFLTHPVHVSMASLYGKSSEDHLMLSVRMYSDDLALDLHRLYNAEGTYSEIDHLFTFTGADSYYQRYIDDHLKIYSEDMVLKTVLVKKEILDLETLLYFELENTPGPPGKEFHIENTILTGLYLDQVNLFILKVDDSEKGIKFTAEKTEETFTGKKLLE